MAITVPVKNFVLCESDMQNNTIRKAYWVLRVMLLDFHVSDQAIFDLVNMLNNFIAD
jgi:hypothetical protein